MTMHPTVDTPPESDPCPELRALREDNEALRYSSLSFADLAERLARRVRELEGLLATYHVVREDR